MHLRIAIDRSIDEVKTVARFVPGALPRAGFARSTRWAWPLSDRNCLCRGRRFHIVGAAGTLRLPRGVLAKIYFVCGHAALTARLCLPRPLDWRGGIGSCALRTGGHETTRSLARCREAALKWGAAASNPRGGTVADDCGARQSDTVDRRSSHTTRKYRPLRYRPTLSGRVRAKPVVSV
jgi:hypothetical protein